MPLNQFRLAARSSRSPYRNADLEHLSIFRYYAAAFYPLDATRLARKPRDGSIGVGGKLRVMQVDARHDKQCKHHCAKTTRPSDSANGGQRLVAYPTDDSLVAYIPRSLAGN
jgi:hypothetical protein